MKPVKLGVVIATRTLDLKGGGKVVVRIGKPRKFRGDDNYFCPYAGRTGFMDRAPAVSTRCRRSVWRCRSSASIFIARKPSSPGSASAIWAFR